MRHQTITCDRCGHIGRIEAQMQEGWRHIEVWDLTDKGSKNSKGYDICFSCSGIWETYLEGKRE